jgi:hypothetical protein
LTECVFKISRSKRDGVNHSLLVYDYFVGNSLDVIGIGDVAIRIEQYSKGEAVVLYKLDHLVSTLLDVDRQCDHAPISIVSRHLLEVCQPFDTRITPGGPEVKYHDLPLEVAQCNRAAIQAFERKVRGWA